MYFDEIGQYLSNRFVFAADKINLISLRNHPTHRLCSKVSKFSLMFRATFSILPRIPTAFAQKKISLRGMT